MADDRRIVIELKVSGGSGDEKTSAEKENEKMTNDLVAKLKRLQNPFGAMEQSLLKNATPGFASFARYVTSNVKNLAKGYALYFAGKYFNLAENYRTEEDLNNTLSVLSHIGGAFTSVIGGAIAGAKTGTGPAGAAAGAIIGATFWVGNTTLDAIKAHDQENINLSTMRIQSAYQKVRLGLIDDGRGTQN